MINIRSAYYEPDKMINYRDDIHDSYIIFDNSVSIVVMESFTSNFITDSRNMALHMINYITLHIDP